MNRNPSRFFKCTVLDRLEEKGRNLRDADLQTQRKEFYFIYIIYLNLQLQENGNTDKISWCICEINYDF